MATEIGRSLEEIDGKVKALNKTLKDSANETKELDKALKLDPKSAETVDRKMQSLGTQVGVATQKVALLKQKQCHTYLRSGRKHCAAHTVFNSVLEAKFLEAYNEFVATKEQYLLCGDALAEKTKILETERKLAALEIKRLISHDEYKAEHDEIMKRLKVLDAEIKRQAMSDIAGKTAKPQKEFSADAVRQFLDRAVITGDEIKFEFCNGFVATKTYTNGTGGNKVGWKLRRQTKCN